MSELTSFLILIQSQTSEDIAEVIKEAICAEKPHFRYQTNDDVKKTAASKYVDPSGDSVVQSLIP